MIAAPPRTILEVFEGLPEGTLAQLINDNIIMSPAPNFLHQDIVTEIAFQIRNFLENKSVGKVIISPIDIYFNNQNIYQPDIIFISTSRLDEIVKDGKVKGSPDLIIEVLSPGTEKLDRVTKKAVYEKCGVREYWIVDPKTKNTDGFRLSKGKFIEIPSTQATIQSVLLNDTIRF